MILVEHHMGCTPSFASGTWSRLWMTWNTSTIMPLPGRACIIVMHARLQIILHQPWDQGVTSVSVGQRVKLPRIRKIAIDVCTEHTLNLVEPYVCVRIVQRQMARAGNFGPFHPGLLWRWHQTATLFQDGVPGHQKRIVRMWWLAYREVFILLQPERGWKGSYLQGRPSSEIAHVVRDSN